LILNEKNGLSFFQFPNLAKIPEIQHGIFTRGGGYSEGPYRSLNTSFGVGDDPHKVQRNRSVISNCLGHSELVFIRQVHGNKTLLCTQKEGVDVADSSSRLLAGDALLTDLTGKRLVVQVADCQSVLLYDPFRKAVANIHCGWRGSIKNVIGHAVKAMATKMGCLPRHIIAGIGPSLGPCCAEFINYKKEIPEKFWQYKDDSDYFDFWSVSVDQLVAAGLLKKNIYLSRMCTKCNPALFFSYRGEGTTGRFAAVIGLK
jgi:YfiH family protein